MYYSFDGNSSMDLNMQLDNLTPLDQKKIMLALRNNSLEKVVQTQDGRITKNPVAQPNKFPEVQVP